MLPLCEEEEEQEEGSVRLFVGVKLIDMSVS